MLDTILDEVRSQLVSTLTQKTGLGAAQAEQAVPLAKDSISEGFTSAISGGNVGGILDLLRGATGGAAGGDLMDNLVYKGIAGSLINKLTARLGLPETMAQTVTSYALPFLLGRLATRTKEAGDSDAIDQASIMKLMGLDSGSLLGKAGGMLGGFLK